MHCSSLRLKFKILLIFIFALSFISINSYSQNLDINLLREINVNRNQHFDYSFKFITKTASPVSIATPIIVFSVGLITKDTPLKAKGIYIGETLVVSTLFTVALKYSINRERPFKTYPDIENLSFVRSPSFPSGHTSSAFATATSLSIAFPKWYVIAPSFLWAGAVGYSRMHLGVHYPSDVFIGAIIGSGSAFLSYKLNAWINKKSQTEYLFY